MQPRVVAVLCCQRLRDLFMAIQAFEGRRARAEFVAARALRRPFERLMGLRERPGGNLRCASRCTKKQHAERTDPWRQPLQAAPRAANIAASAPQGVHCSLRVGTAKDQQPGRVALPSRVRSEGVSLNYAAQSCSEQLFVGTGRRTVPNPVLSSGSPRLFPSSSFSTRPSAIARTCSSVLLTSACLVRADLLHSPCVDPDRPGASVGLAPVISRAPLALCRIRPGRFLTRTKRFGPL